MSDFSPDPQSVVDFWRDLGPDRWYVADDAQDETIRQRFGDLHERAARGELDDWAEEPNGALVLVILLDQFSRNLHRATPAMYAHDEKALRIAKAALARGDHERVGEDLNQFFAMPHMHSERLEDQEACVAWMQRIGEANLSYAEHHRDIVRRFGRFPHRNAILGRESTAEEKAYLEDGGFTG